MANIFNRWVDGRIEKALEERNLNIDPLMTISFDEDYEKIMNKVFYKGNTEELLRWFKMHRPKNMLVPTNYFYRCTLNNLPVMHYPLASMITKTMVNLLFEEDPEITTDDEKINDLINDIYAENGGIELFQKGAELESYSGAVAFKPIIDKEFSEYPILIPYPKEDIEVIKKYDKLTEIVFKDYYQKDGKDYVLCTICGKGYIDYKLFIVNGGKKNEVPLSTIEDLSNLKPLEFFTNGSKYNKIMAIYKENRPGAKSDYHNLTDDFAALDEIYSNMINYIRKSKIKSYIPENVLYQDPRSGKPVIPNDYDMDNIILHDSNPEGTEQKVARDIIDIGSSIQGYQSAFNNVLLNALMTVGLSPATMGLDISGANSSALALNIRERASLRTRGEKIKKWKETLKEMSAFLLALSSISYDGEKAYIAEFDKELFNIEIPEYEAPTYDQKVQTYSVAIQNNLVDLETALTSLYPDKSEEEIALMIAHIEGRFPDEQDIIENELKNDENGQKIEEIEQ